MKKSIINPSSYPEKVWRFHKGDLNEEKIDYWLDQDFMEKIGKDILLRLHFGKERFVVTELIFKTMDEEPEVLFESEEEKEAKKWLFDYIGTIKQQYQLRELLNS